jgi:CDP-diacylglycerol---glycerol-3-phosphate 3-phosphatidyltransferase
MMTVARNLKQELFSLPNLLTQLRIYIIPAVLIYIDNESPLRSFIAALLYSASAATDFADGYLARKFQQVSLLGKFLDPLADKLLVMATLVWMVPMGRIDAWLVVVLLARELSINALRGVASSEGLIIAARQMGKHKTALQMGGILCLIIHFRYPILFTHTFVDFHLVGLYTIYMSLVFSLFSAAEYIQLFARAVNKQAAGKDSATHKEPRSIEDSV